MQLLPSPSNEIRCPSGQPAVIEGSSASVILVLQIGIGFQHAAGAFLPLFLMNYCNSFAARRGPFPVFPVVLQNM